MAKKENKYKDYNKHKDVYHPTGLAEFLGLGRPLDFNNYPTRLALLFSILTCVAEVVYQGTFKGAGSSAAMMMGANVGFSFLFCFMIAMELDPDRRVGGLIGGFLSAFGVHFLGEGNIIVLLWLLWILRMLNRTAGDRHRAIDDVLILGTSAYLGMHEFWIYPLLTGTAYVIESQLPGGYFGSFFLAAMAFATTYFADMTREIPNLSIIYVYMCALAFILFLPVLRVASFCQAKGDKDGQPLYKYRVWAAQGCFILIIMSLITMHGDKQALTNLPAIMAAIGCGAFLPYDLAVNRPYDNWKRN